MTYSPEFWFVLGLIFMVLEVVMGFTIVLLFCGLAAFSMGFILFFDLTSFTNPFLQFASFFFMTFVWAGLLWKPLKKFKHRNGEKINVENYVGQSVTIIDADLQKGKVGAAKWSGTTVKVELHPEYVGDTLSVDSTATVVEVKSNVFIVK